jgi:cell division protein YceG involved in septum cleavage
MSVPKNILYRFAFSKITVITLCAILLALFTVSTANDLFAFVKPSEDIIVELNEPLPLDKLSVTLQNAGVIENAFGFWVYAKVKNNAEELESFSGSVTLNSDMSYRDIINTIKNF